MQWGELYYLHFTPSLQLTYRLLKVLYVVSTVTTTDIVSHILLAVNRNHQLNGSTFKLTFTWRISKLQSLNSGHRAYDVTLELKKALGETQTLRAGRSNAEPKKISPSQTPFPLAHDRQNLIRWRWSLPAPTNPVWWRSMHVISSYRGKRHRPPATDRTDNNPLCR